MAHVAAGRSAHNTRRIAAIDRLRKHLDGHKEKHPTYSDEELEAHDKRQKEELAKTVAKAKL